MTEPFLLTDRDKVLRALQLVELEGLMEIDRICRKYGIEYSLGGGTCLGRVRHGGFIPWDDDIDIFMTRADFEKFRKVFKKHMSGKYNLLMPGDGKNISVFPRIELKGTFVQSIQSVDGSCSGLMLDIFILENTYDNKILRTIHGMESTVLLFIDSVCRTYACKNNLLKYGGYNKKLCSAVKKRAFFGRIFSVVKFEKWLKITDKVFSKVKSDSTKYVVAPGGAKHFFGEIFERDKMTEVCEVKFEDTTACIPKNYDYYLRKRYGADYMTPPSKKSQEKHVFIKFEINKK